MISKDDKWGYAFRRSRNIYSAIGLRQVLPVQTKRILFFTMGIMKDMQKLSRMQSSKGK